MMIPKSLAVLATAAGVSLAATPAGFQPASTSDLVVIYNSTTALNGAVIPRTATTLPPRIGTLTRLNGTSYAILMIDIDIPTNTPPATNTLLHWLQTGLTPATASTPLTVPGSSSPLPVFLLENSTSTTPFVPYFGPNPPARVPLSHRYTQILVDTSGITQQGLSALQQATGGGGVAIGFNASAVLERAGLGGRVVAGNFYNVTNPGPVVANGVNGTTGGGVNETEGGRGTGNGFNSGVPGSGSDGAGGNGNATTAGAGRLLGGESRGMGVMVVSYFIMGVAGFGWLVL